MKKSIFLLIAGIMASFVCQAQIAAGTKVISGNLMLNPLKIKSEYKDAFEGIMDQSINLSIISLMPKVGFAYQENLVFGAGIGFTHMGAKDDEDYMNLKVSMFTIYPYMRYYQTPLEHAGVFLEGGISASFGSTKIKTKTEDEYGDDTYDETGMKLSLFSLGVKPGFFVKLTNSIVFEATIGGLNITSGTMKDKDDANNKVKITNLNLSINPGLTFGFALHLNQVK